MATTLGQKIAALREVRGMTQQQLADELKVKRALVTAWEGDRSSPNDELLTKLAILLLGEDKHEKLRPLDESPPEYPALLELAHNIISQVTTLRDDLCKRLLLGAFNPIVQEVEKITTREQGPYETFDNSYRREKEQDDKYHKPHPLDTYAHDEFIKLIRQIVLPFFPTGLVIFSEEQIDRETSRMIPVVMPDGEKNLDDVRHYLVLDPLDRTNEATRGIAGFSSITIGSFDDGPLLSIVFSLFDAYVNCYYAITGKGARVRYRDGTSQQVAPSDTKEIQGASLAVYVGRPSRILPLASYDHLFFRQGIESSIINLSGCYGFCLVASSQVDAFIEIAKGYAWHDLVSGMHILKEAGGVVKHLDFSDLSDLLRFTEEDKRLSGKERIMSIAERAWTRYSRDNLSHEIQRAHFIAAATTDLAAQIAIELAKSSN